MTLGALLYLLMVGAIAIGALVVIGKIGALMIEGFILLIYHIASKLDEKSSSLELEKGVEALKKLGIEVDPQK